MKLINAEGNEVKIGEIVGDGNRVSFTIKDFRASGEIFIKDNIEFATWEGWASAEEFGLRVIISQGYRHQVEVLEPQKKCCSICHDSKEPLNAQVEIVTSHGSRLVRVAYCKPCFEDYKNVLNSFKGE